MVVLDWFWRLINFWTSVAARVHPAVAHSGWRRVGGARSSLDLPGYLDTPDTCAVLLNTSWTGRNMRTTAMMDWCTFDGAVGGHALCLLARATDEWLFCYSSGL